MKSLESARAVADAILYEGYVLYPYRASAQKNRSRWQFGVVMPGCYAATDPTESAFCQTECILEYTADTVVRVLVRFLQVQRRRVQVKERHTGRYVDIPVLEVDGIPLATWDEAVEREMLVEAHVSDLLARSRRIPLHADVGEQIEPVRDAHGETAGRLVRNRTGVDGVLSVAAEAVDGPWQAVRLRVRVENVTDLDPVPRRREDAMPAALVAVHSILAARSGTFISMVDPPEWARAGVESCQNTGTWPVLAGGAGTRDVMLSAPIILYDHPTVAPESPGDMFDATEIDEILTLRTLALTDAEKREARATDPRAAALIDRVDTMDGPTLDRLHGTIRRLHPPAPEPEVVTVAGAPLRPGSTVRLKPGVRRADAQDMFLAGRLATVEAVLRDVENQLYLAVTLADDPTADLQRAHGRFLYFSPDEVEPA